jgi:hypothetical protein
MFAADALLLGRKTYEALPKTYLGIAKAGQGAPMDFVDQMNRVPKFVASTTLKQASWNAASSAETWWRKFERSKNSQAKTS